MRYFVVRENKNENQQFTQEILNIGRQYDKEGNVSPWWTEETIAAFDERAQCFIDMYDNYTVPELIPILGDDAHVRLNN